MAAMSRRYGTTESFGGFEVVQWTPGDPLGDPDTQIHRLSTDYEGDQTWAELLGLYLQQPGAAQMQGLVVGYWSNDILMDADPDSELVQPLLAAAPHLPRMCVLLINDISSEESEVSWIENANLTPLVHAFAHLTHLGIRGGNRLELPDLRAASLQTLIIEAGGLSAELVRQVMQADLPELRHLELYLGTEEYGASNAAEDLTPLLDGQRFPELRYLGLKNSDHQDQIAQILASAPVVRQLEVLDLSMGVLTDEGAQALLDSTQLGHLNRIDLHFHWLSDGMVARLQAWAAAQGTELDVSGQQGSEDEWRYVALGE
ncbi:STM4015 family protein [Deinococcus sp. QL22]|uniref:STM4015 family protein n=1 Tax=Deinococcus sp. QL22 TaxID=2939437 RepID=UPI002016BF02|nr:STM4015 family protein [Deinococcus sp. QL22]UQN08837.1 STM4015 family protein [Deinococcus sp. QL22]